MAARITNSIKDDLYRQISGRDLSQIIKQAQEARQAYYSTSGHGSTGVAGTSGIAGTSGMAGTSSFAGSQSTSSQVGAVKAKSRVPIAKNKIDHNITEYKWKES